MGNFSLSLQRLPIASAHASLMALMLFLAATPAQAQFYNNEPSPGVYNGSSTATDPFYSGDGVVNDVSGNWINDNGLEVISGPATGTFINNGSYTGQSGAITRFTGATTVEIGGTAQPTFDNLDLQNAEELLLTNTNGAKVNAAMTFDGTLVDNVAGGVNGALRFGTAGTYTWTAGLDDAHHVNGYVGADKTSGTFRYPVGSGTDYRYAEIVDPAGAAVAYLASNPEGTSSFAGSLSQVFGGATWPVSDLATGKAVTVSLPAGLGGFGIPIKLRLVGWNGTQWVDLSGGPTATGNAQGDLLSGTSIAGISSIGIGAGPDPLPVALIQFTATTKQQDAVLIWQTASEQHSAYFQVERSSNARDGFTAVGKRVAAAGNSQSLREYQLNDVGVGYTGTKFYYRLRAFDTDGKSTVSEVRAVQFSSGTSWSVGAWPNPYQHEVSVAVSTSLAGPVSVKVFDAAGRLVREHQQTLEAGESVLKLESVGELPTGVYHVQVQQGVQNATIRLVKE